MLRKARIGFWMLILAVLWMAALEPGVSTGLFAIPAAHAQSEADDNILEISAEIKPAEMVEPGDATISFTITNTADTAAQNVVISSANGLISEPVGQIAAGETQLFNRTHTVTAEELSDGVVSYVVSHDALSDSERKVNYTVQAKILRSEAQPDVEFTRQLSKRYVHSGDVITVTYRVRNSGNVALNSLRVRDTLGDFTGRIEQLQVGETRTLVSRVSVQTETLSSASLSYAVDAQGGNTYTTQLSDAMIALAGGELEADFQVGYAAFSPNTAAAVLTLSSSGNVGYSDIRVHDDVYGGIIAENLRLDAGAAPLEIDLNYPLRAVAEFRWRITAVNDAGAAVDISTNTVTLAPQEVQSAAALSITAAARMPRIRRSGRVTIDVRIENSGGTDVYNVTLAEERLGEIRTFAVIPAGGVVERAVSVDVASGSSYSFSLAYTDVDDQPQSIVADAVTVEIAADGVLPEGARPAFIEFTGLSVKVGGSSLFGFMLMLGCVTLLALIVVLLIVSRRARLEKRMRKAARIQRRKEEMGRTARFKPVRRSPPKK